MNIHEYQAKDLLRQYKLPVSKGIVASSGAAACKAAKSFGQWPLVIKAQVHAGGRGKAGGVALVSSQRAIKSFCSRNLGKNLITAQTDAKGQPVESVLVESCTDVDRELYLGAVIDRASQRIVFMASSEGGVNIEKVAHATPEKIYRKMIDPLVGAMPYQAREMAYKLGLNGSQTREFTHIFIQLAKLFVEKDVSLIEINPLVITTKGHVLCLDAKINIDDNALFRHPDLQKLHDPSQEDARENHARQWDLNYVALDGNIGCMVNGAGLSMGTMDVIHLCGGKPANFLDVGGGATAERVSEAFRIILSDKKVKAILINIFGGIVRCDLIAEGILQAIQQTKVKVPITVRLEGNNAKKGLDMLKKSGLAIEITPNLTKAAKLAVKKAG